MLKKHVGDVCHALARYGVPQADLRDAVQSVFATAFDILQRSPKLIERPHLWLKAIARRTASDARRKLEGTPPTVSLEALIDVAGSSSLPEPSVSHRDLLYLLLDELDEGCRSVVVARDLEELPWEEVAAIHGLSEVGARKRHQIGMAQMRATLERWQAEQRRKGLAVLPIGLATLFDADRAPFALADEFRRAVSESVERRIEERELSEALDGLEELRGRWGDSGEGAPGERGGSLDGLRGLGMLSVGVAIGFAVGWLFGRSDTSPTLPVEERERAAVVAAYSVESSATVPDGVAPATVSSAASARASAGARPRPAAQVRPTALREEGLLLQEAESARARGHWEAALGALRRHEARFPKGQYASQREGMITEICAVPAARSLEGCARARATAATATATTK